MGRFLENEEPYEDAYAPPAFSPMRMTGIVMLLTTILSYAVMFWKAERQRQRRKISDIINRTLDEEGSFIAFAPSCSANATKNQYGCETHFGGFESNLALPNSQEEQENELRYSDVLEQYYDAYMMQAPSPLNIINNVNEISSDDGSEQ